MATSTPALDFTAVLVGATASEVEAAAAEPWARGRLLSFGSHELAAATAALVRPGCLLGMLGSELAGEAAAHFLEGLAGSPSRFVVLAGGERLERFQPFVDADRIYYLSAAPPAREELVLLLRSAWLELLPEDPSRNETGPKAASLTLLENQLSQARTPADASRAVQEVLAPEYPGQFLACFFVERSSDTLVRAIAEREIRQSAATGLVAFVARTGVPLRLVEAPRDPRFDAEADAPQSGIGPWLAMPLKGASGRVLAVWVLARPLGSQPYRLEDELALAGVLERARPHFVRLEAELTLETGPGRRLFRGEAMRSFTRGFGQEGHLLELSPKWVERTYPMLLLLLAFLLVFTVLARQHEYAGGPAVLRSGGRLELTALQAGSAEELLVAPGDRVKAGQLLVRFYSAQESAEVQRIGQELEAALLDRLRSPADRSVERTLAALRAEHEAALERLEERSLRAPREGLVREIRVRPGQFTTPGEVVLSLEEGAGVLSVWAFLPGRYRPQLEAGMPLRLELEGYPYSYLHLGVKRVSPEVLGPTEARRFLPPGMADSLQLGSAPVVLVEAQLKTDQIEADGLPLTLHDGMIGRAEVRVREERLLLALVPALRALWSTPHAEPAR